MVERKNLLLWFILRLAKITFSLGRRIFEGGLLFEYILVIIQQIRTEKAPL